MTDRTIRAVLTGSSVGAVKAFEETAAAADASGKRASAAMVESNDKIGGSFSSMGSKVATVATVAAVGVAALTGVGVYAVKVFGDYQASMAKLNTAMADAGQKWTPALNEQLTKVSEGMTSVGIGSAETADALAKMVTAGIPASTALNDMGVAADLARFKNLSLSDATDTLIKASQGSIKALKDLGITQGPVIIKAQAMEAAQTALATAQDKLNALQQSGTATHKQLAAAQDAVAKAQANVDAKQKDYNQTFGHFNQIIDLVGPKVKGQADAYAHTLPGALTVLKASLEDKLLIPLGQKIMPLFLRLSAWISEHSGDISNVLGAAITVLSTAFDGLIGVISTVADMVGWVKTHFDALAPVIGAVTVLLVALAAIWAYNTIIGAYAAGIAALSAAMGIDTASTGFATVATAAFGVALEFALGPIGLIVMAIMGIIAVVILVRQHFDQVKQVISEAWDWIKDHLNVIVPIVIGIMTGGIGLAVILIVQHFEDIKNAISGAISWVLDFLKEHMALIGTILATALLGPFGLLIALFVTHFGQIRDLAEGFVSDVVTTIASIPSKITGALAFLGGAMWGAFKALLNVGIGVIDTVIDRFNAATGAISSAWSWAGLPSIPGIPEIPKLDIGGTVLQTGIAVVHRGEVFSGVHGEVPLGGGGGDTYVTNHFTNYITTNDPQAVVNALRLYMQRNGSVPITVRT